MYTFFCKFMEEIFMADILKCINDFVWGSGLIFLLIGAGIIFTVKLGFIQLRLPSFMIKGGKTKNSGLSQLKTVCMSLGTTMGTGNIAGAASALAIGGAGSIFWMWVSAFLGMAVVYAENYLSAKFSDDKRKGPMAYLEKGLGCKWLALAFAVFCILASLGMGSMAQISTFAECFGECCDFEPFIMAIIIFAAVYMIIRGGAERIGTAAQYLLPLASAAYAIVCIAVIIICRDHVFSVFRMIFSEAFGADSAAGGIFGYGLSVGIRRGVFSNEAGLGSSPILHSAAGETSPHHQGMWAMFEVFFDTIVCCTLTAVTLLCGSENFSPAEAMGNAIGCLSVLFTAVEMGIFALCTVIGWYFCGETAFKYVFGSKRSPFFTVLYAAAAASGAVISAGCVWTLSDIFNGLMAIPNLLGILLLIKSVKKS